MTRMFLLTLVCMALFASSNTQILLSTTTPRNQRLSTTTDPLATTTTTITTATTTTTTITTTTLTKTTTAREPVSPIRLSTTTTVPPLPLFPTIDVKDCGAEEELPLYSNKEILQELVSGEGNLIRITIIPDFSSNVEFKLTLWDSTGTIGHITQDTIKGEKLAQIKKVIVSHNNNATIKFEPNIIDDVTDAPHFVDTDDTDVTDVTDVSSSTTAYIPPAPIRFLYDCITHKNDSHDMSYSRNDLILMNLEPNSLLRLNYEGEQQHHINITIDMPTPGQGFAAVSLGQGRYGVTSQSVNVVLDTGNNTSHESSVYFTSFNSRENMTASVSSDTGTRTTPPTPTPTTTTTTPRVPKEEVVTVFFMGVNVTKFINQDLPEFKRRTRNIIERDCGKNIGEISYHDPVDCRKRCFMTSGCSEIRSDLSQIFATIDDCNSTKKYETITDLYRDKIIEIRKDLKKEYKARKVMVDSCTAIDIDTEWVWAVAILGVGGILVVGGVAFTVNRCGRVRRRGGARYRQESRDKQVQFKQGGVKSPWEIVDDDDE